MRRIPLQRVVPLWGGALMQINIDGRSVTRVLAVAAATIGVGAAAFFGGQTTRMNDTAVASVKHEAVEKAVTAAKAEDAIVLTEKLANAKRHEREAVRKARRQTRKNERKRADKLATTAALRATQMVTVLATRQVTPRVTRLASRKASRRRPTSLPAQMTPTCHCPLATTTITATTSKSRCRHLSSKKRFIDEMGGLASARPLVASSRPCGRTSRTGRSRPRGTPSVSRSRWCPGRCRCSSNASHAAGPAHSAGRAGHRSRPATGRAHRRDPRSPQARRSTSRRPRRTPRRARAARLVLHPPRLPLRRASRTPGGPHPALFTGQQQVIEDVLVDRTGTSAAWPPASSTFAIVFEHAFDPDLPPPDVELLPLFDDVLCVLLPSRHLWPHSRSSTSATLAAKRGSGPITAPPHV